jgi:hypothetical protein
MSSPLDVLKYFADECFSSDSFTSNLDSIKSNVVFTLVTVVVVILVSLVVAHAVKKHLW